MHPRLQEADDGRCACRSVRQISRPLSAKHGRRSCRSRLLPPFRQPSWSSSRRSRPGQRVLDVACGTGVVAVTAARRGAKVSGLDLSPVLLERARHNAGLAAVDYRFHRRRRRSAALPGRFVRRRAQPVRPHLRPASGRGRDAEMLRVLKKRRPPRILDLAARAFHRPHVQLYRRLFAAAAAGRRATVTAGTCGAIPMSFANGSARR